MLHAAVRYQCVATTNLIKKEIKMEQENETFIRFRISIGMVLPLDEPQTNEKSVQMAGRQ